MISNRGMGFKDCEGGKGWECVGVLRGKDLLQGERGSPIL